MFNATAKVENYNKIYEKEHTRTHVNELISQIMAKYTMQIQ